MIRSKPAGLAFASRLRERAVRGTRELRQRARDAGLGIGGHAHRDRTGREQVAAAVHDARAQAERAIAALVAEELGLELRPQLLGILVDEAALAHHRRELADRQRLAVAQLREHGRRGIAERRADAREPVVSSARGPLTGVSERRGCCGGCCGRCSRCSPRRAARCWAVVPGRCCWSCAVLAAGRCCRPGRWPPWSRRAAALVAGAACAGSRRSCQLLPCARRAR